MSHLWKECCASFTLYPDSSLSIQRIVQLLSLGAFEIRKRINESLKCIKLEANGKEEHKQQNYLNNLIRKERILIEVWDSNLILKLFSSLKNLKIKIINFKTNKNENL